MTTQNNFADSLLTGVFSNVKNAENSNDVAELLEKYGLNWNVSKQKLMLPCGAETPFFGVVREDNNTTFSTCKDGYTPFQNSELAEMLIRLSEKTGYEIHSGGAFNGGGKVFLQLESPNKIQGIGENKTTVQGYLTGINSHDGTTALKWGETNITICCRNTFMAACKAVKNSARHTATLQAKVEQAIREVGGIVEAEKTLFDQFIKLSEIPVTQKAIAKVVQGVTEVDTLLTKQQLADNYSTYSINRTEELLAAIAKEMKQKGNTMWGLISGVTQYTTHIMPAPKRTNGRLESLYTGTGYSTNNEAFATIVEMAGI